MVFKIGVYSASHFYFQGSWKHLLLHLWRNFCQGQRSVERNSPVHSLTFKTKIGGVSQVVSCKVMLSDIWSSKDIALLTDVPFQVSIVNKDVAYSNPSPISISLNLDSILTEIGHRVLTLFKSYIYTLEDKVYKFDVYSWVQERIQGCRRVS